MNSSLTHTQRSIKMIFHLGVYLGSYPRITFLGGLPCFKTVIDRYYLVLLNRFQCLAYTATYQDRKENGAWDRSIKSMYICD